MEKRRNESLVGLTPGCQWSKVETKSSLNRYFSPFIFFQVTIPNAPSEAANHTHSNTFNTHSLFLFSSLFLFVFLPLSLSLSSLSFPLSYLTHIQVQCHILKITLYTLSLTFKQYTRRTKHYRLTDITVSLA